MCHLSRLKRISRHAKNSTSCVELQWVTMVNSSVAIYVLRGRNLVQYSPTFSQINSTVSPLCVFLNFPDNINPSSRLFPHQPTAAHNRPVLPQYTGVCVAC